MPVKTAYLFLYNFVQFIGWLLCLVSLIGSAGSSGGDVGSMYRACSLYAGIFQGLAILETVHAAIGLVPSSPAMALLQWGGRSNILFLVLKEIPQIQFSPAAIAMLAAWAISEVVRYPWYALTLVGKCPHVLTWLRYTLFIPAYPVGVLSEMLLLYQALPYIQSRDMYSISMPNKMNMGFSYLRFSQVGLIVYLPIWWRLYSTLLRQRKKKMAAMKEEKALLMSRKQA